MFSGQMAPRATRKQLVGVAEWRLVTVVFDAQTDFWRSPRSRNRPVIREIELPLFLRRLCGASTAPL
jgi:hypothetical protein